MFNYVINFGGTQKVQANNYRVYQKTLKPLALNSDNLTMSLINSNLFEVTWFPTSVFTLNTSMCIIGIVCVARNNYNYSVYKVDFWKYCT